jgi:hypothetical protein
VLTVVAVAVSVGATDTPVAPAAGAPAAPEVVLLGDSTALTLGVALAATAPAGVRVVNAALWGCGLSIAVSTGLDRVAPCNQATPPSGQWPALDARAVASTGPGDVVAFLAGHWETGETLFADGSEENITQPSFQRMESARLETLYRTATAHGAHLDLLTMPAMDGDYAFGTAVSPTDDPSRGAVYNRLLAGLADRHPGRVSVVPFGRMVSPTGRFQLVVDGVQVRTTDGVHTPSYVPGNPFAGDTDDQAMADRFYTWIGPRLWPVLLRSARRG